MGRGRWWRGVAAAAAASACAAPPLHVEASYIPVSEVCDRVHRVMRDTDEGRIRVELPAAAEMVVITAREYRYRGLDCGNDLMAWLAASVGARPIDLRPRLQARVQALGTLAAADNAWTEPAVKLLGGLLVDEGKPIVNTYVEKEMIDMGSLSRPVWREAVTLDDLDLWVVEALRRGFVDKVPRPNQSPSRLGDWYADFLVRLYSVRYATPSTQQQTGYHLLPFIEAARSPPPDARWLGCGTDPLDLLWPDLVRAFRVSSQHDRWDKLPAALITHLRHPADAPTCG